MANTHTKKITAFMSVVAMLLSMLLYFPGGTFGNMGIGLKASAATSHRRNLQKTATAYTRSEQRRSFTGLRIR